MPRVTVQPSGIVFDAPDGETIFAAARAAGYWWPTSCDGQGECTNCTGEIIAGGDHLSPMGRWEEENLIRQRGRGALDKPVRLCCQARVHGDVEVRRTGVRPW
jgi:ferredoxin, 2Fe-2S